MTINTGAIANLLRPGLKAVFGNYNQYPSQWSEIFKTYDSDKAVEIEVEMRMLGLAQLRPEGAPTAMDTMGQRIITNYVHKYIGLGFVITRQAMVDNLYQNRFPMMATALKNSFAQTKEILAASVINNAFSTAYPIGDGQPLCSNAHPIDGGTFSNVATPGVDLNESSLEAALVAIQQFRSQSNLIVQTKATKLLVGPQNQFNADRILHSAFSPGNANNAINSINNQSIIPMGYTTNQFLNTSGGAWFVLTDADNGFKHYVREAMETDVYTDFSTDNIQCKGLERFSFGASNPRCVFGSNGP